MGYVGLCRVVWVYLTARPGVLIGAIDSYVLANVQRVFDVMSGRRGFKSSDFLIGEKLGEGSFRVSSCPKVLVWKIELGLVGVRGDSWRKMIGLRRKSFLNR